MAGPEAGASEPANAQPTNRISDFGEFPETPAPVESPFGFLPVPGAESGGMPAADKQHRLDALLGKEPEILPPQVTFRNVDVIESPAPATDDQTAGLMGGGTDPDESVWGFAATDGEEAGLVGIAPTPAETFVPSPSESFEPRPTESYEPARPAILTPANMAELWDQETRSARRKLEPEGALTGATRELQAALGTLLGTCHEHGVKVGPWRLQHVVPEWTFGEHPTYGAVSLAHWACKDGQPWKVGVGLFLARGPGKPKDLEIKLGVMDSQPQVVDHLILMRPEDDLNLTGKSKTLWQEAERNGKHARLEPLGLDSFAQLYAFPRWLSALREALPAGAPLPNLADLIQDRAEKLLEQVCMPVHG